MKNFVKRIYNATIRSYLPRKIGVYAGVPTRYPRLFDRLDFAPNHEKELIKGINKSVCPGDSVTLIGGGTGVSAVKAAKAAKPGKVTVYEGATEYVDTVKKTVELNELQDSITVIHAIVGEPVDVFGNTTNSKSINGNELPDCDTLVLDCEGSELSILYALSKIPDRMVIEYHPNAGITEKKIGRAVSDLGHHIVGSQMPEEQGAPVIWTALDD